MNWRLFSAGFTLGVAAVNIAIYLGGKALVRELEKL